MPPPAPERPTFPWGSVVLGFVAILVVIGIVRFVIGVVFGFVRLALIVIVAVAIGAAIVNAKGDQ